MMITADELIAASKPMRGLSEREYKVPLCVICKKRTRVTEGCAPRGKLCAQCYAKSKRPT